jgi:hypothetical protein
MGSRRPRVSAGNTASCPQAVALPAVKRVGCARGLGGLPDGCAGCVTV